MVMVAASAMLGLSSTSVVTASAAVPSDECGAAEQSNGTCLGFSMYGDEDPYEAAVSSALVSGQVQQARTFAGELRQAEAELAACGAQRLRAEAVRELRRIGMRVPRSGLRASAANTTGIAALSGREREVADLVTAGKTNREIAAELFLSEKTVERHLSNIFVKLRARSRVDVARVLERSRNAEPGADPG